MKNTLQIIRKGALFLLIASLILSFLPMTSHAEKSGSGLLLPSVEFRRVVEPEYSLGAELGTARNKVEFNRLLQQGLEGLLPQFTIVYTGADLNELFYDLEHDKTGKYFYGMEYQHWVVKGVRFNAAGVIGNMPITVTAEYHHTADQERLLNGMVDEVLRKMISSKMTDLEKIDAVHDYIVLMTQYSNSTSGSSHSAYTVMTERKGVCQGYATLGYKMLQKLGFEVRITHGKAGSPRENHAWLKVKLDGEWYNLDITFDDPIPDRKNTVHYKYALLSDGLISSDHSEDPNIPFPKASSTKFDGRTSRSPKTYTDAEVQELLNGGGDAPMPPTFDEYKYFKNLGADCFAGPIAESVGRDRFKVLFNKPLSAAGVNDLAVFTLQGNSLVKMPVRYERSGNYVFLRMDRVLPKGVYYVLVGSKTVGANGEKLVHGWYRKFILQ